MAPVSSQDLLPRYLWLAIVAFGLQFFVIREIGDTLSAKVLLGASHLLLVYCIALNWRLWGFRVIGVGLALNLLVTYANGGLMPVAPEGIQAIRLADQSEQMRVGERFGAKSVLLHAEDTRFYALSDRFQTAMPRPMLYSLGDAVLAGGLIVAIGTTVGRAIAASGDHGKRPTWPGRREATGSRRRWG